MPHRAILILSFFIIPLTLGACQPVSPAPTYIPWAYADLRALDPADAPQPSHDLIALYTRLQEDDFQIRLDLLDHGALPDYDLYIALDSRPGGSRQLPLGGAAGIEWDALLVIPASGPLQALDAHSQALRGAALHVLRDPIQDTVVISLRRAALDDAPRQAGILSSLQVQVYLAPPGMKASADSLGPVRADAAPPPPARTLFVFWNVMPAYSPALALRRWDGAHTGPYGGRHGLYNLLRTARAAGIPLALLDLKAPASLAALSHLDAFGLVQEMHASGLLMLPQSLPALPVDDPASAARLADSYLAAGRKTARDFDLPASPFLSTYPGLLPTRSEARLVFMRLVSSSMDGADATVQPIRRWKEGRLLLVPQTAELLAAEQATPAGPSLELRRALIAAALQAAQEPDSVGSSVLLLGGDLPASAWGAPQAARATFRYINAHPWIHPLGGHALLSTRPAPGIEAAIPPATIPTIPGGPVDELVAALQAAPDNPLGRAAWEAFETLYGPLYPQPPELTALREHYQTNIWSLLSAANWAADPAPVSSCELDPDHDGAPECLLASVDFYAQFEIESGALTHAFARLGPAPVKAHQIVAPSSQLAVGLSEPASWDLARGLSADPSVIPGAFYEESLDYQPSISTNPPQLRFSAADGSVQKTYSLGLQGLRVEYRFQSPPPFPSIQAPLALDPWDRFVAGYTQGYILSEIPGGWNWGFQGQVWARLLASALSETYTFRDSEEFLGIPENPNRDYPPGHYLPFPMVQFSAPTSGDLWIEIQVANTP